MATPNPRSWRMEPMAHQSTPQPTCRLRRQETTTAGLTAASTKPSMKPQSQGMPRNTRAAKATGGFS